MLMTIHAVLHARVAVDGTAVEMWRHCSLHAFSD